MVQIYTRHKNGKDITQMFLSFLIAWNLHYFMVREFRPRSSQDYPCPPNRGNKIHVLKGSIYTSTYKEVEERQFNLNNCYKSLGNISKIKVY